MGNIKNVDLSQHFGALRGEKGENLWLKLTGRGYHKNPVFLLAFLG